MDSPLPVDLDCFLRALLFTRAYSSATQAIGLRVGGGMDLILGALWGAHGPGGESLGDVLQVACGQDCPGALEAASRNCILLMPFDILIYPS